MAHVLADFAKANAIIDQNPNLFPDDSSKLALKQSILEKYGSATPEALASAIARLARDGALRATLSRNAAALVRERFTAAGYLEAVSNCLQSADSSSIILP